MKFGPQFVLLSALLLPTTLACMNLFPEAPVTFADDRFVVTKPAAWYTLSGLNDEADLQMGSHLNNAYCIILTESKLDFAKPPSLQEFSDLTRAGVTASLTNVSISGPESITANGHAALRYTMEGTGDNINLKYWHIVVDTGTDLHQVLFWSLRSKFDRNTPDFETVLNSLQ